MSNLMKLVVSSIAAASLAAPTNVSAEELRSVSCSVAVDYLVSGIVRAPYQKDFVVNPGVGFEDFVWTNTGRMTLLDASTYLEAGTGNTIVTMSFYRDVGVFDSIDFSTYLTLRNDRVEETASGSLTLYTSQPGYRTTNYKLTCSRVK